MLFSVIVPVYNMKDYLEQCLDSLLAQTYSDFEAILVDDGSTDGCSEILDAYADRDARLKVIHKPNGGLVSARKAGAQLVSGDYVANLDSDDYVEPNFLEKFADAIRSAEVPADMYICGQIRCENGRQIPFPIQMPDGSQGFFDRRQIDQKLMPALLRFRPVIWGNVIRRDLYLKYQMQVDDRITIGEDGAVTYPCISAAEAVCLIPDCLYYYRIRSDSMIHRSKKFLLWENTALRLAHLEHMLPVGSFGLRSQIDCFAVTSYFRVALSRYRNMGYMEATRNIKEFLSVPEVAGYLKKMPATHRKDVKMAFVLLRFRLLLLLKLYIVVVEEKMPFLKRFIKKKA